MRPRRAREPTARYAVPRWVMVDSSVLIDVLDPDPVWFEWSAKHLAPLVDEGALVINPIIYAELAAGYTTLEALDAAIAPYALLRDALPWEAAFLASRPFCCTASAGARSSRRCPISTSARMRRSPVFRCLRVIRGATESTFRNLG